MPETKIHRINILSFKIKRLFQRASASFGSNHADVLQKRLCRRTEPIARLSGIDCSAFQSEGFLDELNLPKNVPFRQRPHLAFPDHVQNLIALNRSPRSVERSKTLAGIHPPLDPAMVLFHDIV
jgi:hypothetical protein